VKALGVKYEKDLRKALGTRARAGVWFEFEDRYGLGWCQVDFLVPELGVVLEAKYTWKAEAHQELSGLYLPVVSAALGPCKGIVVCRNLLPECASIPVFGDLISAVESSRPRVILHWREETPAWGTAPRVALNSGVVSAAALEAEGL
jgi:hypothetical protein